MQKTTNNIVLIKSMPTEMLLLLELSQNKIYFNNQAIAKLIEEEIDWKIFNKLVERHRMIPLIYSSIMQFKKIIPDNEFHLLEDNFKANQKRMMLLAGELNSIYNIFNSSNIPVLTIKGTPLAIEIYNNVAMRSSRDIDILVAPEDIDKSVLLLEKIGYKTTVPAFQLTPYQTKIYRKTLHHLTLKKPNGAMIELHWRLFTPFSFFPKNTNQLFQNAISVNHFDSKINILDPETNLLYLMVHGSVHRWYQLYWIKDLSEFLYQHPELNMNRVIQRAIELDVLQSIKLGFVMTNLFYKNTFPPSLNQDKNTKLLCNKSIDIIKSSIDKVLSRKLDRVNRLTYLISLQQKWSSKFNILINSMVNYRDWNNLKLPDSLFFLYYPLRPFLWIYSAYIKNEKK